MDTSEPANLSYSVILDLQTSELEKATPGTVIWSPYKECGAFKWAIYVTRAFESDGSTLSFWVNCESRDELDDSTFDLACFANLEFKIEPYKSKSTAGLVWRSSQIFNKDSRQAGWPNYFAWNKLFDRHERIVDHWGTLRLKVIINVVGQFVIVPEASKIQSLLALPLQSEFSEYFHRELHADSIVLCLTDKKDVYHAVPLHFSFISQLTQLEPCFTRVQSRDLTHFQKDCLRHKNYSNIYLLKKDTHPAAFLALVRFFYRKQVPFHDSIVSKIYETAMKCSLKFIAKACTFVYLKVNTVLDLLPAVLEHGDHDDRSLILNFISEKKNCDKIVSDPSFRRLEPHMVEFITGLEFLKVSEDDLADAVKLWAENRLKREHRCNEIALDSVWSYLEQHNIAGNIRVALLSDPSKILPSKNLEWLMFAKSKESRKHFKFVQPINSHKRTV